MPRQARNGGRWLMSDGRFSSFQKEAKGYAHFLGVRKRNQKNIHPYPSSPYMERLKLRTAETDSSECVLVSRDDAMGDERDPL